MRISDWSSDVCSSDLCSDRLAREAAASQVRCDQPLGADGAGLRDAGDDSCGGRRAVGPAHQQSRSLGRAVAQQVEPEAAHGDADTAAWAKVAIRSCAASAARPTPARSEERRVGKGWVRTFQSWVCPIHKKKKKNKT